MGTYKQIIEVSASYVSLKREPYTLAPHLCTNYKLTGLTSINSELIALTAAGDR